MIEGDVRFTARRSGWRSDARPALLAARVRRPARRDDRVATSRTRLYRAGAAKLETRRARRRGPDRARWSSARCSTIEELNGSRSRSGSARSSTAAAEARGRRRTRSDRLRRRATSRSATRSSSRCPAPCCPATSHRRPQDLRPRLRRHDLLGRASSASATTTARHHRAAGRVAEVGADAIELLGAARRGARVSTSPRTAATALSLRGIAREAATAYGVRSATRPLLDDPGGRRRAGHPVAVERPGRLRPCSSPATSAASTRRRRRRCGCSAGSSWPACARSR